MNNMPKGNVTHLVFCREDVEPDVVTRILGLEPTESVRVGDPAKYDNGSEYSSHLGIWKLELEDANLSETVEDQISRWVSLLEPKIEQLNQLKELGYSPYLDCIAEPDSLSLCIAPCSLLKLGELNISLSVWLYENEKKA